MISGARFYARVLRWCSPKRYYRRELRKVSEEIRSRGQAHSSEEYQLIQHLEDGHRELYECLQEIEDQELVDRANRLDIDLGEVDPPEGSASLFRGGMFVNRLLVYSCRLRLRELVRERGLVYRSERREWLKVWVTLVAALTGLAGAAIGVLTLLLKGKS